MGQTELALERYRQAWLATPQDLQVAMSYAELLKRQGDAGAGLDVLAQLPDTPEMRFARIVFALDAGDEASAQTLYAGFNEARYPGAEDLPFHAAQSAELLDDPDEAIRWYGKVTGENALRATMRRAFLLAESGEVGEARNLLTRLRISGDTRVKSQTYQAESQILQQAGQPEEAMKVLDAALVELPDEFPLRYGRALLAVGMGLIELAETDLRHAIAEDPDNAVAINALGYTLADLTDRFDEAEELIRLAYELQPDDPSVIDSMGWIAYRQGRLDIAHVVPEDEALDDWTDAPGVRATLERWGVLAPGSARSDVYERLSMQVSKINVSGGDPLESIQATLDRHPADMLVLATERRRGLPRWLQPSLAEAVARSSGTMTLFVPDASRGFVSEADGRITVKRVLVSRVREATSINSAAAATQALSLSSVMRRVTRRSSRHARVVWSCSGAGG